MDGRSCDLPKHYKIGTRGSLLALTQCNQIRLLLEQMTGDSFELDVIKTQGDLITNTPLWQLEGANFFTKELDEALLSKKVDLVVHSYKDLGSIRPEGLALAAVTKRTYAHDILLIKNQTIAEIKNKKEFIIGTSSPRRMVNLKQGLAPFLPNGSHLNIIAKVLRGNVNTRIQKLRDNEYDAIVLALPGIERLALTDSSKTELEKLLEGINFMILPQSYFPSSASQGALAIECLKKRDDNDDLLNKLSKIQDQDTYEEITRERQAFNQYGGGCHLAVGINVKKKNTFFIHTHRGVLNNEQIQISKLEGRHLPQIPSNPNIFLALGDNDLLINKLPLTVNIFNKEHLYVTSRHCLSAIHTNPKTLWASGVKTMIKLASKGYWVNACADSLGDEEIKSLRKSSAIALMADTQSPLTVLSNDKATSTLGDVISCYSRSIEKNINKQFEEKVYRADIFYWMSYFQYKTYIEYFPQIKNRIHVCGLGKTYQQFLENKICVLPMSSMDEFNKWTNI